MGNNESSNLAAIQERLQKLNISLGGVAADDEYRLRSNLMKEVVEFGCPESTIALMTLIIEGQLDQAGRYFGVGRKFPPGEIVPAFRKLLEFLVRV